ncbi:cellulase family glycosylhydrolase [Streptomyces sp. NBC_01483]|uniref:cellulase family glycosylhydrolase n=1 Tax=Streptomyces sp. NBC_01483 TaxID=2903883 RepID=UPI002E2FD72F|nr:cellulase family glycosylhydrolase [Streptomyces sp. NBC_01483]
MLSTIVSVVVLGIAVGVVVSTSGVDSSSRAPEDGQASGPASREPSGTDSHRLGFGLSFGDTLTWATDAELARSLDDAKELGVRWVRVDLSWRNIQPDSASQYVWTRFDRVVAAARKRGLDVLPTIGYTPRWAAAADCSSTSQTCPPAADDQFAAFARRAAERYAPEGVHTWEIWNEPNIKPFWRTGPNAQRYAALLTATARAIRSMDKDAYLLLGGLAAVKTDPAKQYVSHQAYLAELARLGALDQVNAISYHPYTYPLLPSTRTATGTRFEDIADTSDSLVSTLRRFGKPKMPIWLTETGAPTWSQGTAADSPDDRNTRHVTPRLQAEIASDTVPAAAAIPSVAAVFWFSYRDGEPETPDSRTSQHFGLLYSDGRRKTAFAAWEKAIRSYQEQQQG